MLRSGPSQKKMYHTVLFQGCHGQFLVSIKRSGLNIWKKSQLNNQYYIFIKFQKPRMAKSYNRDLRPSPLDWRRQLRNFGLFGLGLIWTHFCEDIDFALTVVEYHFWGLHFREYVSSRCLFKLQAILLYSIFTCTLYFPLLVVGSIP